jgi:hypothetical protein
VAGYRHIVHFTTFAEIKQHFLAVRARKTGDHLAAEPAVERKAMAVGGQTERAQHFSRYAGCR